MDPFSVVSTSTAAALLGRTQLRVRQLIDEGKLSAEKGRRDWRIDKASLVHYMASLEPA